MLTTFLSPIGPSRFDTKTSSLKSANRATVPQNVHELRATVNISPRIFSTRALSDTKSSAWGPSKPASIRTAPQSSRPSNTNTKNAQPIKSSAPPPSTTSENTSKSVDGSKNVDLAGRKTQKPQGSQKSQEPQRPQKANEQQRSQKLQEPPKPQEQQKSQESQKPQEPKNVDKSQEAHKSQAPKNSERAQEQPKQAEAKTQEAEKAVSTKPGNFWEARKSAAQQARSTSAAPALATSATPIKKTEKNDKSIKGEKSEKNTKSEKADKLAKAAKTTDEPVVTPQQVPEQMHEPVNDFNAAEVREMLRSGGVQIKSYKSEGENAGGATKSKGDSTLSFTTPVISTAVGYSIDCGR